MRKTSTPAICPEKETPVLQFLQPLIEGVIENHNIDYAISFPEDAVVACVLVDETDQGRIIGQRGENIMAMQTIFKEWCLRNMHAAGVLNVLEPRGRRKPEARQLRSILAQADWLLGELFESHKLKSEVDPNLGLKLRITVPELLSPTMMAALSRYLRTSAMNMEGIRAQIYFEGI